MYEKGENIRKNYVILYDIAQMEIHNTEGLHRKFK